jgi:hypothetical protein
MILKKLEGSPSKMVSVGMLLVTVGLMFLICGITWPRLSFMAHLWPDQNDFLRGFCFGFAIVMEATGLALSVMAAAKSRKAL